MSSPEVPATEAPRVEASPPPPPAVAASPAPTHLQPGGLPGKRFLVWCSISLAVAMALAVLGVLLGPPAPGSGGSSPNAFQDATWDDGKAELARYDAERVIYKAPRKYELVQVTVKEAFDPKTRTKPDPWRSGAVDAIKLMRIEDAPSGRLYRYRQTLSLRVSRADPTRLLDARVGSQEWCGNTFAAVLRSGDVLTKHAHSYFDGEGDFDETLPEGTWLDDQLPATLRALSLEKGTSFETRLLPSIVSNRQPRGVLPVLSRITVETEEPVETGLGSLLCSRVTVSRQGDAVLSYWIGREKPHILARYASKDGKKGTLRSLERLVYWTDPVAPPDGPDPGKPPR